MDDDHEVPRAFAMCASGTMQMHVTCYSVWQSVTLAGGYKPSSRKGDWGMRLSSLPEVTMAASNKAGIWIQLESALLQNPLTYAFWEGIDYRVTNPNTAEEKVILK